MTRRRPVGSRLPPAMSASASSCSASILRQYSCADVTLAEGHNGTKNALFKVSLTRASSGAVTVKYATANGTAQAGSDYLAMSGVLTFPVGQLARTVSGAVRGERIKEGNETFFVYLREPNPRRMTLQ